MEINHNVETGNYNGDGANWSDSIATEFADQNWYPPPFKKDPTNIAQQSVSPNLTLQQQQQHQQQQQNNVSYQQLLHSLKGPNTVDQQNQILHLVKSNPALMSEFKKQKEQQSRLNGAINPPGPIHMQQHPSLQHMHPQQQLQQHQQRLHPAEDHRLQNQQFQGHPEMAAGLQFPQQYRAAGGAAGPVVVEDPSVVHRLERAYEQLMDSLNRATNQTQHKKIIERLKTNPTLYALYLEKQQSGQRVEPLCHSQQLQQHPQHQRHPQHQQQSTVQHMPPQQLHPQNQQYQQHQHPYQPGMEINGRMPQGGLISKENISTVQDDSFRQLLHTLKSPSSHKEKQQALRSIKNDPSIVAALRKHRNQKQVAQNSGATVEHFPIACNQPQRQESSLQCLPPQHPMQQQMQQQMQQKLQQQIQEQQYRNRCYQQELQMQQQYQSQSHQESPVKVEPVNQIDSQTSPEPQNQILHSARGNPSHMAGLAQKFQKIEQQGATVTSEQSQPLQQAVMQHVLCQQKQQHQNHENQLLQPESLQGPSMQRQRMLWYKQQQQEQQKQRYQHQQRQQHQQEIRDTTLMQNGPPSQLIAALTRTSPLEKVNSVTRVLNRKPGLMSDFAEQRQQGGQHEVDVYPFDPNSPQQQQPNFPQSPLQQQQKQEQKQKKQQGHQQYSLGPSPSKYQNEALSPVPPPANNQQSPIKNGGFEQDLGDATSKTTTAIDHLKQMVEAPSPMFSSPSDPSPQSVSSPRNYWLSSPEDCPEPSSHNHHTPHKIQKHTLDDELYVPSEILPLPSYPVDLEECVGRTTSA